MSFVSDHPHPDDARFVAAAKQAPKNPNHVSPSYSPQLFPSVQQCSQVTFGDVSVWAAPSDGNRQIPFADPWEPMARLMGTDEQEATNRRVLEGLTSALYRRLRRDWWR